MKSKQGKVKNWIHNRNPDNIFGTGKITYNQGFLQGYNNFQKDRNNGGGGVLIAVKYMYNNIYPRNLMDIRPYLTSMVQKHQTI